MDAGWKACVNRLIDIADLIFLDLSGLKENVIWELNLCVKKGKEKKVILIADINDRDQILNFLRSNYSAIIKRLSIFFYENKRYSLV